MNANNVEKTPSTQMKELMEKKDFFLEEGKVLEIRNALKAKGYHILEGCFSKGLCEEIIKFMDQYEIDGESGENFTGNEINYGGSELRIWHANEKHELLEGFKTLSDQVYSKVLDVTMDAFNILAIRNKAIDVDNKSLTKGRWHIDSFRPQYKLFLFLTETNERSGPFEFVPGTHAPSYKYSMLLKGKYITPMNLIKGGRKYQSVPDDYISKKHKTTIPVICKQGTLVFIDTSALHRARPCVEGSRYALTSYYK